MIPRSTALAAKLMYEGSSYAPIEWVSLSPSRRGKWLIMAERLIDPAGYLQRRGLRAAAHLRGLSAQDWQAAA